MSKTPQHTFNFTKILDFLSSVGKVAPFFINTVVLTVIETISDDA